LDRPTLSGFATNCGFVIVSEVGYISLQFQQGKSLRICILALGVSFTIKCPERLKLLSSVARRAKNH